MNDTNMILEALGAVGESLEDSINFKKHWNPEANKYSRSINPNIVVKLLSENLTQMDTFVLFSLIMAMDSENKIGYKFLKSLKLNPMTLYRAKKRLTEIGTIFEFPDGSIMVNPNIALLSKYRKNCLALVSIWNKEQVKGIEFKQEIEQEERLL